MVTEDAPRDLDRALKVEGLGIGCWEPGGRECVRRLREAKPWTGRLKSHDLTRCRCGFKSEISSEHSSLDLYPRYTSHGGR